MSQVEVDSTGRYVIVVGRLYDTPVILANIYAPNWDDGAFFTKVFSRIPNIDTHRLILGGDMNCVLSPSLDRSSTKQMAPTKAASTISLFLETYGIADIWRFQNPTSRTYSFFSPVHKTYSRIDYFFVDKNLLPLITECDYHAIVISDHAPLVMILNIPNSHSNYRPWRFNTLLLSDETFVKFVSIQINIFLEFNQTPGMSSSVVWESMKAYLRGQIISYSAQLRKAQNERLERLTTDILNIDMLIASTPTPDLLKQRLMLQTEFNLLSTRHAENLINKTRYRTYEFGEKTGKILAHQLRQKTAAQSIPEIKDKFGIKHTDHVEINQCFQDYYSKLYTSESHNNKSLFDSFFDKLTIPSIDKETAADLEDPFSLQELITAAKSMQNGKSPGPDGFPSEFYKTFADQLAPILLLVFDETFESGSLPPTMRQAVISLILKKDKPPLECGSFRPISLLNVDSKLLAKILARRLEIILPSIISDDQTGFIKNRHSFFNLRRLYNILYDPTPPDTPEVIISLDAEKAFDRVEWDYLFYTLDRFGFGPKLISWIKILYFSPLAAVRTNSTLSPFFSLRRGTRQGCPLSPLLFAVAIEPLAAAIRSETGIKGIQRGTIEHKVSLYADDMLLYISDPLISIPKTIDLLNAFGRISGYKINLQKSELMPVNAAAKSTPPNLIPFKMSTHKFKYLGIWVTHHFKDLYKANFPPLMATLKQDLERWDILPLALGGRINTIKMNVLPRFLYIFQCLPIFLTKTFFMSIDRLISSFIWKKQRPRINKSILQRHRLHGGLGLPNFRFYYWAANISIMLHWKHYSLDNTPPKWLLLEGISCRSASLHALLCSKLPFSESISTYSANPIVKHSLKIWAQFRRSFSLNDFSIHAPITKNNMFAPSMTDEAYDGWAQRGLIKLSNMYDEGNCMSFEQLRLKYNIPRTHFFRFLQLRSFLSSSTSQFPSLPPDSFTDSLLSLNPNAKQVIGTVYSLLNSHDLQPLTLLKGQWEEDLGISLSDEAWQDALDRIHSSSVCLKHTVIQFKIVHRLHWSKVRLAKFTPDIDPTCDRCKQAPATLSHMFWQCPRLSDFWLSIFKFISEALEITIEPSAIVAIFGVIPPDTLVRRHAKIIIAFTTLLARRLILLKWKDTISPTFSHWIKDLMYHLTLEKIRCSTRRCSLSFEGIWQPVLTCIEKIDASKISTNNTP